jgi:hypothetical protein
VSRFTHPGDLLRSIGGAQIRVPSEPFLYVIIGFRICGTEDTPAVLFYLVGPRRSSKAIGTAVPLKPAAPAAGYGLEIQEQFEGVKTKFQYASEQGIYFGLTGN